MSDVDSEPEPGSVPQHEPPADAELVQPEVDERHDSIVVEGDDPGHVLPPTELDPFTPEPAPPARGRFALVIALVTIVIVLAVVSVYAAVR